MGIRSWLDNIHGQVLTMPVIWYKDLPSLCWMFGWQVKCGGRDPWGWEDHPYHHHSLAGSLSWNLSGGSEGSPIFDRPGTWRSIQTLDPSGGPEGATQSWTCLEDKREQPGLGLVRDLGGSSVLNFSRPWSRSGRELIGGGFGRSLDFLRNLNYVRIILNKFWVQLLIPSCYECRLKRACCVLQVCRVHYFLLVPYSRSSRRFQRVLIKVASVICWPLDCKHGFLFFLAWCSIPALIISWGEGLSWVENQRPAAQD